MPGLLEQSWIDDMAERGFSAAAAPFSIGRPDRATVPMTFRGTRVVVKRLPIEVAQRAFVTMQKLWDSPFGRERGKPALPQPLDLIPEVTALVMEDIGGEPMAARKPVEAETREAIELLAGLHSAAVDLESHRSSRGLVRSAERKADRLSTLAPAHAALAKELVAALDSKRPRFTEVVPTHGDFSPRNVLLGGSRPAIIDWERAQMCDPARDLAYFATYSWLDDLKRGRWPNRRGVDAIVALYTAARPAAEIGHMEFFIAAGLLRRATSLVELWPQQAYLVPALLKTALRQLE